MPILRCIYFVGVCVISNRNQMIACIISTLSLTYIGSPILSILHAQHYRLQCLLCKNLWAICLYCTIASYIVHGNNVISGLLLSKSDLFFWIQHNSISLVFFVRSIQKRTDNKLVLFLLVFVEEFNGINGLVSLTCEPQRSSPFVNEIRKRKKRNENPVNRVFMFSSSKIWFRLRK